MKANVFMLHSSWKKGHCPNVIIGNKVIPTSNEIKYLGLTLDKHFIRNTRIKLNRQTAKMQDTIIRD